MHKSLGNHIQKGGILVSWVVTSMACGALAGVAVTISIVADTRPYVNEYGEEDYTLSGYLLLSAAHLIKWPFKKLFELVRPQQTYEEPRKDVEIEIVETDSEYELII